MKKRLHIENNRALQTKREKKKSQWNETLET